jgi:CheY-like chemotaxis protein
MNDSVHVMPAVILMVDDNAGDVRLVADFFKTSAVANDFHSVENGEEAMDFLHRKGHYVDAPRPDLILLDLNLPRKNGQEVLMDIKSNPVLKAIPVIVFTVCGEDHEVLHGYHRHANCLICKPFQYERYLEVLRAIERFWLTVVTLPFPVHDAATL